MITQTIDRNQTLGNLSKFKNRFFKNYEYFKHYFETFYDFHYFESMQSIQILKTQKS
jgi:hypothetical protein